MVIGSTSTQQTNLDNTLNFQSTISSSTLAGFEQELTSAIEGYLGNSGNGSQIEINVQPGQVSGTLRVDVTATPTTGTTTTTTVTSPAATTPTSTPAPSPVTTTVTTPVTTTPVTTTVTTTPVTTTVTTTPVTTSTTTPATVTTTTPETVTSTNTVSATVPATTPATDDDSATTTLTSNPSSDITPADAYWAEQPAAVQALRYCPDDEKAALAQQLASEGYTIDVPIMVDGEDPLAVMIQRQEEGYTWVPSALQPSVEVAPGVSMPGEASYDPDDPPAGSIQVSTAFADGTDIAADPVAELWLQGESSSTSATTS